MNEGLITFEFCSFNRDAVLGVYCVGLEVYVALNWSKEPIRCHKCKTEKEASEMVRFIAQQHNSLLIPEEEEEANDAALLNRWKTYEQDLVGASLVAQEENDELQRRLAELKSH